jgi:hypothetical protein
MEESRLNRLDLLNIHREIEFSPEAVINNLAKLSKPVMPNLFPLAAHKV